MTWNVTVSKTGENMQSWAYKKQRQHKQKRQSQGSHAALRRFQFFSTRLPW